MFKAITLSVLSLALLTGFASAQLPPGLGGTTQPAPASADSVDDLCGAAAACVKSGEFKKAQVLLLKALKKEPKNEEIAVALAFVSNLAGDHDTAIAAGLNVLNHINANSALAFREVGLAYGMKAAMARQKGDSKAAEFANYATACLVKSLQINKNDKNTWGYLVSHLEGIGDHAGAASVRKLRQQEGV